MLEEGTDTLNYFEDTYIGRQIRRTRRAPLFQVSLWNMIDDLPQTNNIVEAWHRRFSSLCGCSHPHIWKFLDLRKKEIIHQDCRTAPQNSGHEAQPQGKKYKDSCQRLRKIVCNYSKYSYEDFLSNIAYNLCF